MKEKEVINGFCKNYFRIFFYENPKSIIILLNCITESHYTQEIANLWFKEGSPIFSKNNTISKMIDANLITLDKKINKTHYYKTNRLMLSRVLKELYNQDLNNIQKNITDDKYIKYLDPKLLKKIFKDSKQLEKLGMDYLNYIFTNTK